MEGGEGCERIVSPPPPLPLNPSTIGKLFYHNDNNFFGSIVGHCCPISWRAIIFPSPPLSPRIWDLVRIEIVDIGSRFSISEIFFFYLDFESAVVL